MKALTGRNRKGRKVVSSQGFWPVPPIPQLFCVRSEKYSSKLRRTHSVTLTKFDIDFNIVLVLYLGLTKKIVLFQEQQRLLKRTKLRTVSENEHQSPKKQKGRGEENNQRKSSL